MAYEPVIVLNGLSQVAAAAVSLFIALKLRRDRGEALQKPFWFLSAALIIAGLINLLWFFRVIDVSEWDNLFIGPLFNFVFLAVWFYVAMVVSGHRRIYYLIPVFIMSANVLLLFNSLAVVCDVLIGLVLIGVFFHLGFVDHYLVRRMSYAGMAYGFLLPAASVLSYFIGLQYVYSLWFLPNLAMVYLLYLMGRERRIFVSVHDTGSTGKHHIPVVVEVFKFGFYIVCLCVFLMLGTLGVHEMGHSLVAKSFGCSYQTRFDISHAVTHVECESAAGSSLIVLGGFVLTLVISLLMYFMGNDFARKLAFLIFGFSIITAVDDFIVLGLPYSAVIAFVFVSAIVIGIGMVRVVKDYELEYEKYEAGVGGVCAAAETKGI